MSPSAPARPYDAVIFDVDGVLVDSMPRHYEAYRQALAPYGVEVQRHEVYEREGKSTPEVITSIANAHGRALTPEEHKIASERKQAVFATFGPQPMYGGAREFVEALRARGVKIGLVTGTYRKNVERHLGEFVSNFDATVTSNDVTHTKPHPEPYLKAIVALGVMAERALVVENALNGISSGKAAGARVYAVASTMPPEGLKGADRVFPDIRALGAHVLKELDGQ